MLGSPQAGLQGAGGPGWGGGARWALGAGGNRTIVRVVAPLPSRGVRPTGAAPAVDSAPGTAGAAIAAWAGEPRRESGGAVPAAPEVVAGAVDLFSRGGRRADQQHGRAGSAAGRAMA